ncbi:MAG: hypothetical protein Q7L55_00890 [Actinomycetota bacterium]|nr:hypothetical protein [Actinomycetota bacterium]
MRVRIMVTSVVLALPLVLAACGGSNANSVREESIAGITEALTKSGASQQVIDCMTGLVNQLSDDDIKSLDAENASNELQAKFAADSIACASQE